MSHPRACLVVLDGWGLAPDGPGSAVSLADTPVFDDLWALRAHAAHGRRPGRRAARGLRRRRGDPEEGERRELVDSPRAVPTHDHKPDMSAREAADAFVRAWREDEPGFGIINGGVLADVAPTLLALLGVEQPEAMTGRSLLAG